MNFLIFNPRICTLLGVDVTIHISMPLVLLVLLIVSPQTALFALLGYLSILPHEFGHILAARYYGVGCKKVVMSAIGGMALLESMPKEWQKELWITAWGPIVSLILCLWSAAFAVVAANITNIFMLLSIINGILFLFNVLPVMPMDGGRLLRAALASHLPYLQATKIAVRIGQGMAIVLAIFGILTCNMMLPIMMMVILLLGESELHQAVIHDKSKEGEAP